MTNRGEPIVVFAAIVTVSFSVAVTVWSGLGLAWPFAALAGMATAVVLLAIATRSKAQPATDEAARARIQALEQEVVALRQQQAALEEQLHQLGDRVVEYSRTTVRAVASELDMVGSVVRDLAEAVAMHDAELFAPRSQQPTAQPAAPQPPVTQPSAPGPRPAAPRPSSAPAAAGPSPPLRQSPPQAGPPPAAMPEFPVDGATATAWIRALQAEALDILLQPVQTLPQRKTRYYDAQIQLADGAPPAHPEDLAVVAQLAGLVRRLDGFAITQATRIARHLASRGRDVAVLVPLGQPSWSDGGMYQVLATLARADAAIVERLLLRVAQHDLEAMTPLERDNLEGLRGLGYRFVLTELNHMRVDPRSLFEQGFRAVQVGAPLLLAAQLGSVPTEIHPGDFPGLLARGGLAMIVSEIDRDEILAELAEFDIGLVQGAIFGTARPVRQDILSDVAAAPEGAAASAAPPPSVAGQATAAQTAAAPSMPAPVAPGPSTETLRQTLRAALRRTSS